MGDFSYFLDYYVILILYRLFCMAKYKAWFGGFMQRANYIMENQPMDSVNDQTAHQAGAAKTRSCRISNADSSGRTITIPCRLSQIEPVRDFARQFGNENGWSDSVTFDVTLTLEEIVSNIIIHGGEACRNHPIVIWIRLIGNEAVLVVEDCCNPFNPTTVPPPDLECPLEDRQIGGLGIHLVRQVMDDMEYRFESGKNILQMRKQVNANDS